MSFAPSSVEILSPWGGIPGNSTYNVTVKGNLVSVDTTFQLYCNDETLVTSGSGGAFPTSVTVPAGHSGVVLSMHYGNPAGNEAITIAAGQVGVDMSNSGNWQAHGGATVLHEP